MWQAALVGVAAIAEHAQEPPERPRVERRPAWVQVLADRFRTIDLVISAAWAAGAVEYVERVLDAIRVAGWDGLLDSAPVREESRRPAQTRNVRHQPVLKPAILQHHRHVNLAAIELADNERTKLRGKRAGAFGTVLSVEENDDQIDSLGGEQSAAPCHDRSDLFRYRERLQLPLIHRLQQDVRRADPLVQKWKRDDFTKPVDNQPDLHV